VAVVEGSDDHLAWEARQRRAAGAAAAAAGALTFIGTLWRGLTLSDIPRNGYLESLARLEAPGTIGTQESLRVDSFEYYHDNAGAVLASGSMVGLGYLALGWALTYLAFATRARRPEFPRAIVYLPLIAGVLQSLATITSAFGTDSAINGFLDGDRTVDAATDIGRTGLSVFASLIGLPGALGLALALVMISLNAMRVGLLTRFLGVIGIITGVLQILPIGGPLPIVQCFWLLMLSALILGHWPGGRPPAWQTGNAEPWPSGADMREQRKRAAAEARGEVYEPAAEQEPEPVGAGPSPSASARKRKRKRR
jgi:hypothetical protein